MMIMNNPQRTRKVQGIIQAVMLFLRSDIGNKRVCVLVEGPDDSKLYPKFFKNFQTRVMVIRSGGKPNMLDALKVLINKTNQAIGICDADFYHLEKKFPTLKNVFLTDYHDIEMTMLNFNLVKDINLQMILQETAYIGYTRWYNDKHTCNLNFKKIDSSTFFMVSEGKPEFDFEKYLSELNKASNNKTMAITANEITNFIKIYKTDDYFNLCNGHDVILAIILIIGNITLNEFKKYLQDSFTLDYFMQTNLYKSIFDWQTFNCFNILKTETEALNG